MTQPSVGVGVVADESRAVAERNASCVGQPSEPPRPARERANGVAHARDAAPVEIVIAEHEVDRPFERRFDERQRPFDRRREGDVAADQDGVGAGRRHLIAERDDVFVAVDAIEMQVRQPGELHGASSREIDRILIGGVRRCASSFGAA